MKKYIRLEKVYSDYDVSELKIDISDGYFKTTNMVYIGNDQIDEYFSKLSIFKQQIHGGIFDLEMGKFPPEYASGAFYARFQFQDRGIINISVKVQSDFFDFGKTSVAREAKLFLKTEPALLDIFISDLKLLNNEVGYIANLECIDFN